MTTSDEDTSIRLEVLVAVPVEQAFRVFTENFDRIKPREHNLLAAPIAETVLEPHVGGSVYDRAEDGTVCRWARVLVFEPPNRFVISWGISPLWQLETDADRTSEVEVRFIQESPSRTRVELDTGTSTTTATAGNVVAMRWARMAAGRSTCIGSVSSRRRADRWCQSEMIPSSPRRRGRSTL